VVTKSDLTEKILMHKWY